MVKSYIKPTNVMDHEFMMKHNLAYQTFFSNTMHSYDCKELPARHIITDECLFSKLSVVVLYVVTCEFLW